MAPSVFTSSGVCLSLNNSYNRLMLCNGKLKTCGKSFHKNAKTRKLKEDVYVEPKMRDLSQLEKTIELRRNQAKRSVAFQIPNKLVIPKLINYCSMFGAINSVHLYTSEQNWDHALLEFQVQKSLDALINSSSFMNAEGVVPIRSQFMWFKNNIFSNKNKLDSNSSRESREIREKHVEKTIGNIIDQQDLFKVPDINVVLNKSNSISQQMTALYNNFRLLDTEIRLRFLTANQLESSFSHLFPDMKVFPFGSSINGFGKRGCDLDLIMLFGDESNNKEMSPTIFHTKSHHDEKQKVQFCMEVIGDQMSYLLPGIKKVKKILNARVPIIKYNQSLTNLDCDLSMSNMIALHMSELLFVFGEFDQRVRPLIFTIRKWANEFTITRSDPGRYITNFPLTLLVLYFLQTKHIIPTVNHMRECAGKNDFNICGENVDCTFQRDVRKINFLQKNFDTLEMLLLDFFLFYAKFDFTNKAISIREGKSLVKPNFSPMYICNPLESQLNVSLNVSTTEVDRLQSLCAKTADLLCSFKTNGDIRCLANIFNETYIKPKKSFQFTNVVNQTLFENKISKDNENANESAANVKT